MDDARTYDIYALYQVGRGRLEDGNPVAAVEVLELAVEKEPHKASLHEALGRAYFASSRVRKARAAFERSVELDPTDHYAHFGIARCYEREGMLAPAAKHLKIACALKDDPEYHAALERVQERLPD